MAEFTTEKFDHYAQVAKDLCLDSVWSIYEVEDLYADHPFHGAREIVYFNYGTGKSVSEGISGNSFAALFVTADDCIRASGDNHHKYIEHFSINPENPRQLLMTTGS